MKAKWHWVNLLVLLAYLGVALGMTWPLVDQMHKRLPGPSDDTLVHYWNGWWVKKALTLGQSPFYTRYLYYPTGISLVYHNFAWFSIVTWLALEPLVGGYVAYNLSILANLALCGLAAFLLAYELTGDRRAAFLAGLLYECWPFRLSQLDHPNLISTQWIPLFLLFLIRAVRLGRWRDGVLAGVFLALTGYTRWQQLVPAAILGGIYLLCTLPGRRTSWRRWGPVLLIAGVIAAVALTPPALMLIRQQRTEPVQLLVEDEEEGMQTDLLAYLTPGPSHSVLNSLTQPAYARYYADRSEPRRFAACVGVTTSALALLGMWKARRAGLIWVAMAVVLILLALGPILRLNGQLYLNVPMPYRLAARLYVVRLLRVPDRFNMFLASPVAMLSAHGVAHVMTLIQKRGKWATFAVLGLLGAVILFEYVAVPVPLIRPKVSEFHRWLSAEPDDFAVLDLPIDTSSSKRYMAAQVTHQHPILQGKTPRFPQGAFDYLNSQPWIRALQGSGKMPPTHTDVSRQLETLAQDGVRYVILDKKSIGSDRLAHWRHYFLVAPRFEDERIVVYTTSPLAARDFALMDELTPGIGPVSVAVPTDCLNPGQPLGVDVGWGATAAPGQDLEVRLALVAEDGLTRHEQVFPLSADWLTGEWPANAVAHGYYVLDIPPSLPGGDYAVTMGIIGGRSATVKQVMVSEGNCAFPIPPDATYVNALFGSDLRLLGYQLQREGDQLTVTLHWRSECLIATDYKVFVHVFDPAIELRVAQDDAMPLRWTYPTTFWNAGEVVVDAIPLSLEDAPAGSYSIAVGVYDAKTGDRLSVVDRAGQSQPGAQIVLPGEEIEVAR
jgi:hypothetical protein